MVHIFRQALLEGIHSVALGCTHEECVSCCLTKGKALKLKLKATSLESYRKCQTRCGGELGSKAKLHLRQHHLL